MTVRLVINIEGGLVQAVYTNNPAVRVECAIADYDIEGVDPDMIETDCEGIEYIGRIENPVELPDYVNDVFETLIYGVMEFDDLLIGDRFIDEFYGAHWIKVDATKAYQTNGDIQPPHEQVVEFLGTETVEKIQK